MTKTVTDESLLATEDTKQGASTTQDPPATEDTQADPEEQKHPEGEESKTEPTEGDDQDTDADAKEGADKDSKADDDESKDKEPEGAPEQYQQFEVPRGMPEGFELDAPVLESFVEVARDLDLSQDKAQTLIDKVIPVIHRRAGEQQTELHEQWRKETRADKEIRKFGESLPGSGDPFDRAVEAAKKAVKAFGNDELRNLLDGPLGSHKGVVHFLATVGKTVSEDKFVGGDGQGGGSVDLDDDAATAKAFYDKTPQ